MIYKIFLLFLNKDETDVCQTYTPKIGSLCMILSDIYSSLGSA